MTAAGEFSFLIALVTCVLFMFISLCWILPSSPSVEIAKSVLINPPYPASSSMPGTAATAKSRLIEERRRQALGMGLGMGSWAGPTSYRTSPVGVYRIQPGTHGKVMPAYVEQMSDPHIRVK